MSRRANRAGPSVTPTITQAGDATTAQNYSFASGARPVLVTQEANKTLYIRLNSNIDGSGGAPPPAYDHVIRANSGSIPLTVDVTEGGKVVVKTLSVYHDSADYSGINVVGWLE